MLAIGERRQLAIVPAGKIPADLDDVRGDEMEVVEEPFGGRRDEPALVHVRRERAVRLAQGPRILVETWKNAARAAARRVHREPRAERQGSLVQPLDAEQLVAKRLQYQSRRP